MIQEKINTEFKKALKERNSDKIRVIRSIKSMFERKRIEKNKDELNEQDMVEALNSCIKQRNKSIESFQGKDRNDLIEQEETEKEIIESYLPQKMSIKEVEEYVNDTIEELNVSSMKDMGKMMATLKEKIGTKVDMSELSKIVKEKLS